jgi:HAMP domain-containing protein
LRSTFTGRIVAGEIPSLAITDVPTSFLHSLRARLLVLFAALAVGPLLTVGVFDYVRSRRSVDTLISNQTDSIAHRAAATIRDRYAVITSDILLLTENADVQRYAHALIAGDSTTAAAAREGAAVFVRAAWEMDSVSYYAMELRDLHGARVVRLTNDADSGYVEERPTIVSAVLDRTNGRAAATLVLTPRLDALIPRDGIGPPLGRTGETIVIDRNRQAILRHPNPMLLFKAPRELFGAAWPAIGTLLANPSGTLEYTDHDSLRVGSFVSLSTPAWTVVSSTAVAEFADTFARTRAIDVAFLLALGCVVAVAFFILVGRATASLEDLTHAAAAFGSGDLTPVLPRPSNDEVGTLSRAFAEMTTRVRSMMREIEVSRQLAVLGEFAAQLSHEVRNPLTSLKLDLQGMQRQIRSGALPPAAAPAVESALREINRLDIVV